MDFSQALQMLKNGNRISRSGWNGKDQFVYLVPGGYYKAQTKIAKEEFGAEVPYGAYLAIKPSQGPVVPWLASQTDLLAEDWMIV